MNEQPTLESRIASVRQMLDQVEAFLQDLRNAPHEDEAAKVLGWPAIGLYVRESRLAGAPVVNVGNVLQASIYTFGRFVPTLRNGNGDVAELVSYERAIASVITLQENLHTWLCGQYRDLLAEAEAVHDNACAH